MKSNNLVKKLIHNASLVVTLGILSTACAAPGHKGDDNLPKPADNAYLQIDEKLSKDLESKNVEMLITVNKDGKLTVIDTKGQLLSDCKDIDHCSGLRDVTVRLIESPVILKTTRNPTCIIFYSMGQAFQKCW
ncbi:MAG: hypothetical protein ACOY4D_05290 [Pseudomonadota bacterium]